MKHFGHDCDALDDAKIAELMAEHGLAGYGFYFACLELIGQKIKTNNVSCELQYNVKSLSFKFRTDLGLTKDYLSTILGLGLFWQDDRDDRVYCFKMLSRIEKNVAQNPQFKELLDTFYKSELYKYYVSTNQGLKTPKIVPSKVVKQLSSQEDNHLKNEVKQLSDELPATPKQKPNVNGGLNKELERLHKQELDCYDFLQKPNIGSELEAQMKAQLNLVQRKIAQWLKDHPKHQDEEF